MVYEFLNVIMQFVINRLNRNNVKFELIFYTYKSVIIIIII